MLNIWVLCLSAVLGWSTWWLVLNRLTPCELLLSQICTPNIDVGALVAFFIALFIALSATLALAIFFLRRFFSGNEIFYAFLVVALRQGILVSLGMCLLLLLKALQVFFWWDGLIIILVMVLIELSFHRKPITT